MYMKKVFLTLAVLCAVVMMAGCKGGTADKNTKDSAPQTKTSLIGQWVAVDGYEQWGCVCEQLDSVEYHYLAFSIDEDSITMVMHDKFSCEWPEPPYSVFSLTYAYSVDSGNVVTGHIQGTPDFTLFKIRELSADTLFIKADCSLGDGTGKEFYTMKRK